MRHKVVSMGERLNDKQSELRKTIDYILGKEVTDTNPVSLVVVAREDLHLRKPQKIFQISTLFIENNILEDRRFILNVIQSNQLFSQIVEKICNKISGANDSIEIKLQKLTDLYLIQPSDEGRAEVLKAIIDFKVSNKDEDKIIELRCEKVLPQIIKNQQASPMTVKEIVESSRELFKVAVLAGIDLTEMAISIKLALSELKHPSEVVNGNNRNYLQKEIWPPVAPGILASIEDDKKAVDLFSQIARMGLKDDKTFDVLDLLVKSSIEDLSRVSAIYYKYFTNGLSEETNISDAFESYNWVLKGIYDTLGSISSELADKLKVATILESPEIDADTLDKLFKPYQAEKNGEGIYDAILDTASIDEKERVAYWVFHQKVTEIINSNEEEIETLLPASLELVTPYIRNLDQEAFIKLSTEALKVRACEKPTKLFSVGLAVLEEMQRRSINNEPSVQSIVDLMIMFSTAIRVVINTKGSEGITEKESKEFSAVWGRVAGALLSTIEPILDGIKVFEGIVAYEKDAAEKNPTTRAFLKQNVIIPEVLSRLSFDATTNELLLKGLCMTNYEYNELYKLCRSNVHDQQAIRFSLLKSLFGFDHSNCYDLSELMSKYFDFYILQKLNAYFLEYDKDTISSVHLLNSEANAMKNFITSLIEALMPYPEISFFLLSNLSILSSGIIRDYQEELKSISINGKSFIIPISENDPYSPYIVNPHFEEKDLKIVLKQTSISELTKNEIKKAYIISKWSQSFLPEILFTTLNILLLKLDESLNIKYENIDTVSNLYAMAIYGYLKKILGGIPLTSKMKNFTIDKLYESVFNVIRDVEKEKLAAGQENPLIIRHLVSMLISDSKAMPIEIRNKFLKLFQGSSRGNILP